MRNMFAVLVAILISGTARADMFGGDDLILAEILSNAVEQLTQLLQLVQTTQNNLQFMRDLNHGINDSLRMAQTMRGQVSSGLYSDLKDKAAAAQQIQAQYGLAAPSPEADLQTKNDTVAAEAIAQNNAAFAEAATVDQVGEDIKAASHTVSPGGAQKLTAEGLGVMLHVMDETLRTQATGIKLEAQRVAAENHREKTQTKATLQAAGDLSAAMRGVPAHFATPRF